MLGLVLVSSAVAIGYCWGLDLLVCRSSTQSDGRILTYYHFITIIQIGGACHARFGHFQTFMLRLAHKTLQGDRGRGSNRRRPRHQVSPYPLLWNT